MKIDKTRKNKKQNYKIKHTKHTKQTHKLKKKSLLNIGFFNSNSHNQHKLYDRKSDFFKYQFTPKLKGGKFIDKGGFGCVITPAIPCSRTDKNLDKSISKIKKHNHIH